MERVDARGLSALVPDLADLLVDAVAGGASVGFLHPLAAARAREWWRSLEPDLATGRLLLWTTRHAGRVVGTAQLRRTDYENGRHRGEVAKLLVHRDARGRGLGRALLTTVEQAATELGMTLLLLDTQSGSPADHLYRSAGWVEVGVVPDHALDPAGARQPTTIFRKALRSTPGPRSRT
ncbi:GNAT family N-acetyltransferase [Actinokineospora auranticolor]|uniref:Acetyltransferase (GNAT) family protein n=1 Tax=Actinokineospora auranticolor TaxID=155976 RepID=A0A2S6GMI9_9PSEU|nr:GNAT family N-acetyltransferase [Actinokineospora auranticolor]PPK66376.1 acetyltransferase (GNAT) family protein [Actinokineospora auranticolor]